MENPNYTKTLRMYFANVLLPGLFFDDIQKFGDLIFVEGDEKQKRLSALYNSMHDMFKTAVPTVNSLGLDKTMPLDSDVVINENSFMVKYAKFEKDTGLIIALVGLPKPMLENECWAVVAKYGENKVNRYFTLDFDGYSDPEVMQNPYYKVCEFVSKGNKVTLQKFDHMQKAVDFIDSL